MRVSVSARIASSLLLLVGFSLIASGAGGDEPAFDYPVPQADYIPGSYNRRSFYYDKVHLGEDIKSPEKAKIKAIGPGTIVEYRPAKGYGELAVVIEHDLGREYEFVNGAGVKVLTRWICSIYGHVRSAEDRGGPSLKWKKGDAVEKGDVVGYVNDDAHNGDGEEHLHLGIRLTRYPGKWAFYGYESITYPDSNVMYFAPASVVISKLREGTRAETHPSTLGGADRDWPSRTDPGVISREIGKTKGAVDVMFCIDATNSMQDDIDEVKKRSEEIVRSLKSRSESVRIGLVTYRDYSVDGERHLDPSDFTPLTDDLNAVVDRIKGIKVSGGGDDPEDVIDGLFKALEVKWRPGVGKFIILMGDAPAHEPDRSGKTYKDVAKLAEEIDPVHVYGIEMGGSDAARTSFESVTELTGGTLMAISSAEELPDAILKTLDKAITEHHAEVYAGGGGGDAGSDWQTTALIVAAATLLLVVLGCAVLLRMRLSQQNSTERNVTNVAPATRSELPSEKSCIFGLTTNGNERRICIPASGGVIGRRPDCAVVLDDPQVSRDHALVFIDKGRANIRDLNSTAGTLVNGLPVALHELQPGDQITVGSTVLRFESVS